MMAQSLVRIYDNLDEDDQQRIARYVSDPVMFLIQEYDDLSTAEQLKFKKLTGITKHSKPRPKVKPSTPKKVERKEEEATA